MQPPTATHAALLEIWEDNLSVNPIKLQANNGHCLALKIVNAAVIGDSIEGYIEFEESTV